MCHRRHVDTSFDDDLGERAAKQVLDRAQRHRSDAGDLAELPGFERTAAQRLSAHVEHDLGTGRALRGAGLRAGLAEARECVGEVGVMRLAPALRPRLHENVSAQRLEGITHERTFDWSELASDRDSAVEGRPEPEVTALSKPGFTGRGLLFGSLGGDHGLATLAEVLQEITTSRLEQLWRGRGIGFEGREEHRRLSRGDVTASECLLELRLSGELSCCLEVPPGNADALPTLSRKPSSCGYGTVALVGPEQGRPAGQQQPGGSAELLGTSDLAEEQGDVLRRELLRFESTDESFEIAEDRPEAGCSGGIEHMFEYRRGPTGCVGCGEKFLGFLSGCTTRLRMEPDDSVATFLLGLVQRQVGPSDEVVRGVVGAERVSDTDAAGEVNALPVQLGLGEGDPLTQTFRHGQHLGLAAGLQRGDDELVAADSRTDVGATSAGRDGVGNDAKGFVTALVAEVVVDRLQLVQVDEEQGDGSALASGSRKIPADGIQRGPAIEEAREAVADGERMQFGSLLLGLADRFLQSVKGTLQRPTRSPGERGVQHRIGEIPVRQRHGMCFYRAQRRRHLVERQRG